MIETGIMRTLLLLCLSLVAACNSGGEEAVSATDDNRIECRIGASTGFERHCTLEQADEERGRTLTIRKPDGGFRRLRVTDDGRGVVAADGAEPAIVTNIDDGRIDVAIGGDNFRLPATIRR